MIAAGEPAPDFTLRDQDGEEVSLADFRGRKVLLVFYPIDFSPVCSDQLSIYQEVKPEIDEQGRRAARDQRRPLLRPQGLPGEARRSTRRCSPTSSPRARSPAPTAPTSRRSGFANRTLVLIDEEGIVAWAYESPTPGRVPRRQRHLRRARRLTAEPGVTRARIADQRSGPADRARRPRARRGGGG